MKNRMNRMEIAVGSSNELKEAERAELANMSVKERLETITYLRECFYGTEATTGRLQRFYKVFKRT